jgi:penicillin-binding protein 2
MRIYEDLRGVQVRIGIVQYLLLITIGILLSVFWYLQVLRKQYFRDLAENNQSRIITIAAPRGPMEDRHGRLLVENRPSFRIVLRPEDCPDLGETISRLSRLLQTGESRIRESVALRPAPFQPVIIKSNASDRDVATIRARRIELPQVRVDPVPLRFYPLTSAAAHVLGRVGEITARQLYSKEFAGVSAGTLVGQTGLETTYNDRLMGKDGYRRVIVNSRGLEVQEAKRVEARAGPTLMLTLDADLQKALESAFAGRSGSGVILDPKNGDVLALVSRPAYDPNLFAAGITPHEWSRLVNDDNTPLMNRVIQGQYAPGSLFKIVVAAAALEEGIITPNTRLYCSGQISMYGTMFHCKKGGHGVVDLHKALAQSCNVFFYQVGSQLEIGRIARYAKLLGLGAPTGIDLPYEVGGLVPTPEWKLGLFKIPWYAGETVSVAIGQGQVTVTPIQMARLVAVFANGGFLLRPRLIRSIGGKSIPVEAPVNVGLSPETLNAIRAGLSAVVNQGGTGWRARLSGVEVCGKTGSAQVVASVRLREDAPEELQPHAWFVGFAPADDPRVAFAILVEHGIGGGRSAAPLAHEVLSHIFHGAKSPSG